MTRDPLDRVRAALRADSPLVFLRIAPGDGQDRHLRRLHGAPPAGTRLLVMAPPLPGGVPLARLLAGALDIPPERDGDNAAMLAALRGRNRRGRPRLILAVPQADALSEADGEAVRRLSALRLDGRPALPVILAGSRKVRRRFGGGLPLQDRVPPLLAGGAAGALGVLTLVLGLGIGGLGSSGRDAGAARAEMAVPVGRDAVPDSQQFFGGVGRDTVGERW